MTILIVLSVLVLVAVHLFTPRLSFLETIPRSRWLSAAGGISVAYVFLHLLPELAEGQEVLREAVGGPLRMIEHHAYLVAFAGLALFYGLERSAKLSRARRRSQGAHDAPEPAVFWLHLATFGLYNLLIGYLLVHGLESVRELIYFALAMALHFLVADFGLRDHYNTLYADVGRWVLAAAVTSGAVAGMLVQIPQATISVLVALLAGGVILNVLKEELPEERESRFSAFLLGGSAYAALLLAA